jgi:hypothetical protein
MLPTSIITSIITAEFEKNVGRWQSKNAVEYGMKITFDLSLHDYDIEEGYRHLEILIYGPANYIGVYVREDWTVIPINEIKSNGEGLRKGKDYRKGKNDWVNVSYHDSGWRDGIKNVLDKYEDKINHVRNNDNWYEKIQITKDLMSELDRVDENKIELGKNVLTFKLKGKKVTEYLS